MIICNRLVGFNDFVAYRGQLLVLCSELRVIIIDKNGKMEKNIVLAAVALWWCKYFACLRFMAAALMLML